MNAASPIHCSVQAFSGYQLVSFGELQVPDHPLRFGFQVDLVPNSTDSRTVLFALVNAGETERGFAVKVDLLTGEVWDLLNDCGLIGWVEKPLDSFSEEEPLTLSWEVEHYGAALIPKLQIGQEVFLYPALRYTEGMDMQTITGGDGSDKISFLHPAAWRESM